MSITAGSSTASLLSQISLVASSPYTETKNPYTGKITYTYNAPTPISIDANTLTAALSIGTNTASAAAAANTAATPTPPWSSTSTAPQSAALVSSVSSGAAFFNPAAAVLDAPAGTSTKDYQGLFALYQGLTAMQGLATAAGATGVSSTQQAAYAATFAKGLAQLQTYVAGNNFNSVDVALGTITAKDQSTHGATQETDKYTTGTLTTGSASTAVSAFSGPVAFSATLKTINGGTQTVNFDLSEMGSTTRSMSNVVTYLNSKLSAAGAVTRFADVRTPGVAQTTTVNGATVTLGTSADTFALQVVGSPLEAVTFTPATSTPAVYVTSSEGVATAATSIAATTSDVTQQITKLDGGSDAVATSPSDGTVSNTALPASVTAARATATGPDGSLYVLQDVNAATSDGQSINGTSDVALSKYDSAGNLLYTRTLGAANAANGYALSVSADGSQVAIAGSTTGPLDSTDTSQAAGTTSSFVSVYSSAGEEQWTNTQTSTAGDVATGVAFGSNGQVFVTGTATSAMLGGGGEVGGQDSYIRGYQGASTTASDGTVTWKSSTLFTQQFGATGTDKPAGIAVSGNSLIEAGVENGHAVVRNYTLNTTGAPTLSATRDLGALNGGEVAGVSIASDGSVIVAGSTHNGALSGGTVTNAYTSGKEAFVAKLSATLAPSSSDDLNYIATGGDLTAKSMTLSGGTLYLSGAVAGTPTSTQANPSTGYVAAINPATGAVSWSRSIKGIDGVDSASSVAVAQNGTSALDKLGLPTGTLNYAKSQTLVANTSLRAGDTFQIKVGSGAAQTITIGPNDTYATLAQTINRVTGYQATASTTTLNGQSQLKIVPLNSRTNVQLLPGSTGQDALAPLGLTSGEITLDDSSVDSSGKGTGKSNSVLGLNLTPSINLGSTAAIKAASTALSLSIAKVENLYQDMVKPATSTTSNSSGTVPAYLTAQIANYQLALSRLTGSS